MTTLTASARDEIPAVLLEVTGAADGPLLGLARFDVNSPSTATPVRMLADQEVVGGSLVVYDYEAALTGEVVYEVLDSAGTFASSNVITTAAPFPHLHAVTLPHAGASLVAVTQYDSGREASGTTHWPIMRSTPVIVSGPMRTRAGSLTAWCGSYEDARIVEGAVTSGEVVMLRQPTFAGMDMYCHMSRVALSALDEDTTPRRWEVRLDWTETSTPTGPLQSSAAWNFDDVKALGTFATVKAAFATFHALAVGP